MPKLTSQTSSVEIDNVEYPKNSLCIAQVTENSLVVVKTLFEGKIIAQGKFSDWRNSSNVPYSTKALLITALRSALFA